MENSTKKKVTFKLTEETLKDRQTGYYPTVETLNRRCKEAYGVEFFYDVESDCCAVFESEPSTPKPDKDMPPIVVFRI